MTSTILEWRDIDLWHLWLNNNRLFHASYVTAPLLHHWTSTQISSFGFQSNPVLTCRNQQIRKCLNHPSQSKWNLNWIWPIHSNWCIWLGHWSNCKWIIRVHVKAASDCVWIVCMHAFHFDKVIPMCEWWWCLIVRACNLNACLLVSGSSAHQAFSRKFFSDIVNSLYHSYTTNERHAMTKTSLQFTEQETVLPL